MIFTKQYDNKDDYRIKDQYCTVKTLKAFGPDHGSHLEKVNRTSIMISCKEDSEAFFSKYMPLDKECSFSAYNSIDTIALMPTACNKSSHAHN